MYLGGKTRTRVKNDILEFNPSNKTMVILSEMTKYRGRHAVSIIDNVEQICPTIICPGKIHKKQTKNLFLKKVENDHP